MKPVLAITAAIASAAATVAHAGQTIKVDASKVSPEAKAAAKQFVEQSDDKLAEKNFAVLLSALDDGSEELSLDIRAILASTDDSTRNNNIVYNPIVKGGCYTNCYQACHGSRGWR